MGSKFLTQVPPGPQRILLLCADMPPAWDSIIRPREIATIQTLTARARQFERELVDAWELKDEMFILLNNQTSK